MSLGILISPIVNTIVYAIPAYGSYKAIESNDKASINEYLKYWMIIGLFTVLFTICDLTIFWFPFYTPFKYLLLLWLCIPSMKGYQTIYDNFLSNLLNNHYDGINDFLQKTTQAIIDNSMKLNTWIISQLPMLFTKLTAFLLQKPEEKKKDASDDENKSSDNTSKEN